MPEGDTVWLACRRLHDALAGSTLTATDFRVPQLAVADLTGCQVKEVLSRGKHQLFRFDDGQTLHTHFKMEGSWHLYRPGAPRRGGPDWQVRAVLATERWEAVGYRLPVVEIVPTAEEDTVVGHLGPDLLGPDWDAAEALARLRRDPGRTIGEALLDQRNLAGIGNMYMAELCFTSGVHPLRPIGEVPDLERLVRRARQMLDLNKERAIQSTTGDLRPRERMWVYRRDNSPCRRCGAPVAVAMRGPAERERASYWCPRCQPED